MATNTDGFMAIDFETAGAARASACAVGWAIVDNGSVISSGSQLIDPEIPPDHWGGFNIMLHGIAPSHVTGMPKFSEVWTGLNERRAGRPLVAHHAPFDIGVISDELTRAAAPLPELHFACSSQLARRAWPELISGSLPFVAEWLGLELHHHEPRSDALAAAQITLKAVNSLQCASLHHAIQSTGLHWGELSQGHCLPFAHGPHVHARSLAEDYARVGIQPGSDPSHPLFGAIVVFTGFLSSMSRSNAKRLIYEAGGIPGASVNRHTTHLVVGHQDLAKLRPGASQSQKFEKAQSLRSAGQNIDVISEDDFLRLVAR